MMDRFIRLGYVIITHRVESVAAELASALRQLDGWDRVFGPDGMDPHRLMCRIPDDVADALTVCFRSNWMGVFPYSTANDWVAIKSLPGGPKQPPHTDFTFPLRYPHLDHEHMPAGIIVALEPGAHVYVYGWNRLFPDPREEVRIDLDVGDAIIFRGDLIHAGGSYATENIRLHAYLDVVGVPRRYNRTFIHPMIGYDQGDPNVCPLYGCEATGSKETLQRHLGSRHSVRLSRRLTLAKKKLESTSATAASEIPSFGRNRSSSESRDFGQRGSGASREHAGSAKNSDSSADPRRRWRERRQK